jgi:hypothetical protein
MLGSVREREPSGPPPWPVVEQGEKVNQQWISPSTPGDRLFVDGPTVAVIP